jgi:hypothetical protein
VGSLRESFGFADAAGHRTIDVHPTCAPGVFSSEQQAAKQRLAEQVRPGGVGSRPGDRARAADDPSPPGTPPYSVLSSANLSRRQAAILTEAEGRHPWPRVTVAAQTSAAWRR